MAHVRSSTYSSPALIRAEWREVYKGQAIGGFDDLSDKPISDLFRHDRRWAPAWETLARERLFSPPKALRQHQILQRSLYLDSAVQPYTFYVEILATTIRAISGLSRQTPSLRIVKSAGSNTVALTKSKTALSTFGRSGSMRSKTNFDDPSRPSCIMPMVGS
jgi:hypothetical protein